MDFEDSFEEVADLADRGILRSYLLMAGEKACAYVLGYHFRDVFYYVKVGYDQAFAASSPGTGLLYLLIKDLIENTSARRLNFDYGDAAYKREFGNVHGEDATVLLLRKTLSNRLRRQAHEAYTGTIRRMKTWFSRRSTPGQ
jgi:CelD/BcsL family acetyltransferase involved in cellulose biosynthesis